MEEKLCVCDKSCVNENKVTFISIDNSTNFMMTNVHNLSAFFKSLNTHGASLSITFL